MKRLSYERRKSMYGRLFILIWVVGILLFFVSPFIKTIVYSVSDLNFRTLETTPAGITHYARLFIKDTAFLQNLSTVLMNLLYEVPIIVMFSLFIAVVLNRQFVGRLFFRAVFFLPVIVMSGVVFTLLSKDTQSSDLMQESGAATMFSGATLLNDLLSAFGFGKQIIDFISNVVSRVIDTVWKSGVQILLCLAGLQSVSPALYEAARMEGATKWEEFWKITFPMLTPVLLVSMIYTIIDSFTASSNKIITYINTVSFHDFEYSYGCAMSMTYCGIMLVIIGAATALIGRAVVYTEK